jgi:hypothetical protein
MSANYIGYAAAIIWITLPFVYMATAPDWWKSPTGRALMWLLGSTAALFVLLLTGGLFGNYPFKEWVRGGVFAAVLFAGIRLSVLFVQLRIEVERKIRAEEPK